MKHSGCLRGLNAFDHRNSFESMSATCDLITTYVCLVGPLVLRIDCMDRNRRYWSRSTEQLDRLSIWWHSDGCQHPSDVVWQFFCNYHMQMHTFSHRLRFRLVTSTGTGLVALTQY